MRDNIIGTMLLSSALLALGFLAAHLLETQDLQARDLPVVPVKPAVWEPNRQFIVDETCVNYECHKGIVLVSVNDKMLFLSKDGKTIMVPVVKMEIIKDHYFFVFEQQRGFFSIGIYDNVAFMYLDKDNIVLHLYKSSINPNK